MDRVSHFVPCDGCEPESVGWIGGLCKGSLEG